MNWSLLSEFAWLRPHFLWLLLPFIGYYGRLLRRHTQTNSLSNYLDPQLLTWLSQTPTSLPRSIGVWSGWLFGLLSIVALAGPSLPRAEQQLSQQLAARVLVLNLNQSMLAEDERPSRLSRAKQKMEDILKAGRDAENALVIYAGSSSIISPLSQDYRTLSHFLPALTPDIMPEDGNNPAQALQQAQNLLKQAGYPRGDIIWFTDSLPAGQIDAISQNWPAGYRLKILSLGTTNGAPIPSEQGLLRDNDGKLQLSKLDLTPFYALSQRIGASVQPLQLTDQDLPALVANPAESMRATDQTARLRQDWGFWLLIPLLILAVSDFRLRGLWSLLLIGLVLPQPSPAADLGRWWRNADQQGQHLLQQNQAAAASQTFVNPDWQAVAQYQAKDFAKAEQHFKQQSDAQGRYNLGNSLAQQGKYQAALEAYKQALQQQPDFADAQFNQKLVQQLLEQQNQDQQGKDQQGKDQQGKDQAGKDQAGKDQAGKDQAGKDQAGKDQQGKDQQGKDQQGKDQQGKDQQGKDQQGKDQAGKDQAGKDQQGKDQQGKDQQGKDQQGKDQQGKDQQGKDQQGKDQQGKDQQGKDQQGKDQQGKDQQGKDQQGKDQAGKEQAAKEQAEKTEQLQAGDTDAKNTKALDQETEQWLRVLPDDPGGLLREKLYRRYQRDLRNGSRY